jgi:hypothetical protein
VGALQQATPTIPIVFVHTTDPVGSGFVANFPWAGGNAIGFGRVSYKRVIRSPNFPWPGANAIGFGSPKLCRDWGLIGDGKLALVVANGTSDSISVLLGNGDGTFQAQTDNIWNAVPIHVTDRDREPPGVSCPVYASQKGAGR